MTQNKKEWQLSFDRAAGQNQPDVATDVCQALERIFEYPGDAVSMLWAGRQIRIPYVYGISDILGDVIGMMEALGTETGEYTFGFTTNEPDALDADWSLRWCGDTLVIDADWRCGGTGGGAPSGPSEISVSKCEFVASWRTLLAFLLEKTRDVRFEHDEEWRRMSRLVGPDNATGHS
ncbi:MAG: hypothetical protein IT372_16920 [Polyangiaceae bacterium]|nr:hypothetical protein [Polyangiaceae bacterium]